MEGNMRQCGARPEGAVRGNLATTHRINPVQSLGNMKEPMEPSAADSPVNSALWVTDFRFLPSLRTVSSQTPSPRDCHDASKPLPLGPSPGKAHPSLSGPRGKSL